MSFVRRDTFDLVHDHGFWRPASVIRECEVINHLPPVKIGKGTTYFHIRSNDEVWHDFIDDREGHIDAWIFITKMAKERGSYLLKREASNSGRSKGLWSSTGGFKDGPTWRKDLRKFGGKLKPCALFRRIRNKFCIGKSQSSESATGQQSISSSGKSMNDSHETPEMTQAPSRPSERTLHSSDGYSAVNPVEKQTDETLEKDTTDAAVEKHTDETAIREQADEATIERQTDESAANGENDEAPTEENDEVPAEEENDKTTAAEEDDEMPAEWRSDGTWAEENNLNEYDQGDLNGMVWRRIDWYGARDWYRVLDRLAA